MVDVTCNHHIEVLAPVPTASLLHACSGEPLAWRRASEEKLAALALSISAERGEPPSRGPRRELYVDEIRDALMPHGPPPRAHIAARLLFFEALAAYSLPRPR